MEALLTLWRRTRDPAVARAILARTTVTGQPIADAAAFDAVAALQDVDDIPRLLAAVTDGDSPEGARRLQAIAARGSDPRVIRAIERWIVSRPYSTPPHADVFWRLARGTLEQHGYLDQRERVQPLAATLVNQSPYANGIATRMANLTVEPFVPGELDDGQRRALEDLRRAAPAPPRGDSDLVALEARVVASPDLEAIGVLSDALIEREDPRGLFMALQLAGLDDARQEVLLDAHRTAWLGTWLSVTGTVRFRAGVPHTWVLDHNLEHLPKLKKDPHLQTLRAIEIEPWVYKSNKRLDTALAALLKAGPLPHLRRLGWIQPAVLAKAHQALSGLHEVWLRVLDASSAAEGLGRLPRLRVLALHLETEPPPSFWAACDATVLRLEGRGLATVEHTLACVPPTVQSVHWWEYPTTPVRFDRTPAGWEAIGMSPGAVTTTAMQVIPANTPWRWEGTVHTARVSQWSTLPYLVGLAEPLQLEVHDRSPLPPHLLDGLPPLHVKLPAGIKPPILQQMLAALASRSHVQTIEVKGGPSFERDPSGALQEHPSPTA